MLLSKGCEYGLSAVLFLAARSEDGYVPIRTISSRLDISYPFLAKVLQQLTRQGILTSMRGPNGGVALGRPAEQIALKEVVVAIDGPELFTECVLGLPDCGDDRPCPMHDEWGAVRDHLEALFGKLSVAEAAERSTDLFRALGRCREASAVSGAQEVL